jgi:hypothetical protein
VKLVASLIVRNEIGRYLQPCIEHLQAFCDEIRVLDDGSTDGTREWLEEQERVAVAARPRSAFFEHEGRARNALLGWTFSGKPTHVLAIDADELVSDGAALRAHCETNEGNGAWTLGMEEIWKADPQQLWMRSDGSWRVHQVPILWRAPRRATGNYAIEERALACGREPLAVRKLYGRAVRTGASVLHFGWTNEMARAARYARYVEHDGGKHHAGAHLRSIMFPDRKVRLSPRPWPEALEPWKATLLNHVTKSVAPAGGVEGACVETDAQPSGENGDTGQAVGLTAGATE